MNEENYIQERFGKRNPFRVPEGYFDGLATEVMARLPERKPKARFLKLRPVLWAAACVSGLLIGGTWWLFQTGATLPEAKQLVMQDPGDASFDEATDYVMFDNNDIYACLSDY